MDELLKALAEAVRQGSHFAMPALIGYYVVRVVDALMFPVGLIGIGLVASRTILRGMGIFHEKNVMVSNARDVAFKSELQVLEARGRERMAADRAARQ